MPQMIYTILQVLLYSVTGCLVYLLFKLTINRYAAIIALIIYLSDSQTILIATSSPFWDFITETFVLLQLLTTIGFLKNFQMSKIWVSRMSIYFVTLILVYAELLLFDRYRNGLNTRFGYTETHNNYLVLAAIVTTVIFSSRMAHSFLQKVKYYSRNSRFLNQFSFGDIQFFILTGLNTTFSAVLGRFSTSALPLLLLLASSAIFLRKNRTRQNLFLYLSITCFTTILLFQSNFLGSNSIPKTFFFISGLLSAPNLLAGHTSSFTAFPIGFSDSGITNFLQLYPSQLSVVQENAHIFAGEIFDHFKESLEYITVGWIDTDRFISGLNLHSLLNILLHAHFGISLFFFCGVVIFCFARNLTGLLLVGILLICMITFSRLETHQWWYLQLFGLWLVSHSLSEVPLKMKALLHGRGVKSRLIATRLLLPIICAISVVIFSSLSNTTSNAESISSLSEETPADWVEMIPQTKTTQFNNLSTYAVSSGMKAIRFTTNHNCEYSELQAKFLKRYMIISEYRAKLGGSDSIYFPVPATWYDKAEFQIWTNHDSCRFSIKSSSENIEIRHASFLSTKVTTSVRNEEGISNLPRSKWITLDVPPRESGYKAFSSLFIQAHRDQNPLTIPIGTAAEGYLVENLKSISLSPSKYKSAIISGELASGTLAIATKNLIGDYPSLRVVAPDIADPYFAICIDIYNARTLELGYISNQYSYSKLRLKLNPDIKYVDTCSEKYKNLSTEIGFIRSLH